MHPSFQVVLGGNAGDYARSLRRRAKAFVDQESPSLAALADGSVGMGDLVVLVCQPESLRDTLAAVAGIAPMTKVILAIEGDCCERDCGRTLRRLGVNAKYEWGELPTATEVIVTDKEARTRTLAEQITGSAKTVTSAVM